MGVIIRSEQTILISVPALAQHPSIIEVETARVLSQHALVINWTGDVRSDIRWYEEIAPYVITLFTNVTDVEKMRQKGYKADYLQCGYDQKYYFQRTPILSPKKWQLSVDNKLPMPYRE